jgi:hypothetical protein
VVTLPEFSYHGQRRDDGIIPAVFLGNDPDKMPWPVGFKRQNNGFGSTLHLQAVQCVFRLQKNQLGVAELGDGHAHRVVHLNTCRQDNEFLRRFAIQNASRRGSGTCLVLSPQARQTVRLFSS